MNKINAESIIFDLDGTLWDSADNVALSWNNAVKALAVPSLNGFEISGNDLRNTMGMTMDGLARHFFPTLPEDKQLKVLEKCMDVENEYVAEHGGTLYPCEEETLKKLAERYSKVEVQIDKIEAALEKARIDMLKDISVFDIMYKQNLDCFRELGLYIQAGKETIEDIKQTLSHASERKRRKAATLWQHSS